MKVLALLSGGKDSVAAIEVARGHAWDVVAALVMVPAEDDAWMFHTPNLAVVRGVAMALGIPLLEVPCRSGPEAEVEDLQEAIRQARDAFGLDGIVSGALASEYQKTRIDRIGHALGIATFAPLWHKDRMMHLRGLLDAGYDMRFSRTAADGVDNAWAGTRLTTQHIDAMAKHPSRPDIAGEGGEYETLVLDAPHYGMQIAVQEADVEATASRATWHVRSYAVLPKPPA